MLKKIFRPGKPIHWDVVEKETVDEIIFRTTKVRNRLILELIARGGMRIGEVLKLTSKDACDQKLTIQSPKSGKDAEVVFIPRKVLERLRAYIKERAVEPENRIFPVTYAAARIVVKKAGRIAGPELRPHDLRRHNSPGMRSALEKCDVDSFMEEPKAEKEHIGELTMKVEVLRRRWRCDAL